MQKTKYAMLSVVMLLSLQAFGQDYLLSNEQLIYTFNTRHGKKVMLAGDTANHYIIYRFGTKDKVEFEYPQKTKESWKRFTYSFYLRGGGASNDGMDLNYVYFTNIGYRYVVYNTYFADEDKIKVGVKVINLKTGKVTDIEGEPGSAKGSLTGFRDNGLLDIGEKLFD